MAEKKMTQVTALEIAAEVLAEFDGAEENEARAIIKGMIEKRRNRVTKPRVNKEAEAFRAELVKFLESVDAPCTNAEIAAHFEVKPQKIANNVRVLEKAGTVERIRGEKPSDKDRFALA